jgi:hypothetical protein
MSRRVITAPKQDAIETLDGPLIYLAGPIQGAVAWQTEAIKILGDLAPDVHVASPRGANFDGGVERHLAWEQVCIDRAARDGVILFWCAREVSHRCNRAYGAQIRFDLGEWTVKSSVGLARLVVGIERGFTGGPYLQRRYALNYPHVPVCHVLRQTCAAAAELAVRETPRVLFPRRLEDLFVPSSFAKNSG